MMKTKEKIVYTSIELFNKSEVAAVTTNHIAKELNISPGNLYFHFHNKEEIIQQIFKMMVKETYLLWRVKKGQKLIRPLELIEKNYELFWKYRFLHREIFYLRRRDPVLAKAWKQHLAKVQKMMVVIYKRWLREGWMLPIQSQNEIEFMANVILATASNFLQYFDGSEKLPAKQHLLTGKKYVSWILMPWTQGEVRQEFELFVFSDQIRPPQSP